MMTSGQNGSTAQADAFTKMWTDFMTHMMSASFSFSPESPPPEMARSMRGAMFQAMSRYAQDFMRSPQFLEAMKQSTDTVILFKKALNDFLGRMQFELQNASRGDMDALFTRLRHMEMRIFDRLDDLAARLEQLERFEGPGAARRQPGAGGAEQAGRAAPAKELPAGGAGKRGGR
jgi:hypothetical protein